MQLPFTTEQFLNVFQAYNLSVWPMQIILVILAVAVLYFAAVRRPWSGKGISLILAFFWIWMGLAYHLLNFSAINKAAYLFGILTISQGILFLYFGFIRDAFTFRWMPDMFGIAAGIIILYALAIYPILGATFGHAYPHSPTFGLPCPTTIFTFGVMLLSDRKMPMGMAAIPLLWSVIGFTAALSLGITEDIGLLAAGAVTAALLTIRNRQARTAPSFSGQMTDNTVSHE